MLLLESEGPMPLASSLMDELEETCDDLADDPMPDDELEESNASAALAFLFTLLMLACLLPGLAFYFLFFTFYLDSCWKIKIPKNSVKLHVFGQLGKEKNFFLFLPIYICLQNSLVFFDFQQSFNNNKINLRSI